MKSLIRKVKDHQHLLIPFFSRSTTKNDKGNNTSGATTLNSKQRRCFKCYGFGHISLDCPTKKVISFVEEDDEEESPCFVEEPDGEVVYADLRSTGTSQKAANPHLILIWKKKLSVDSFAATTSTPSATTPPASTR